MREVTGAARAAATAAGAARAPGTGIAIAWPWRATSMRASFAAQVGVRHAQARRAPGRAVRATASRAAACRSAFAGREYAGRAPSARAVDPGSGVARRHSPARRCRGPRCPTTAAAPRRSCSGASRRRLATIHGARRRARGLRRSAARRRRQHARGDEQRRGDDHVLGAPALDRAAGDSPGVDLDACTPSSMRITSAPGQHASPQRLASPRAASALPSGQVSTGSRSAASSPGAGSHAGLRSSAAPPRPTRWPCRRRSRRGSSSPGTSAARVGEALRVEPGGERDARPARQCAGVQGARAVGIAKARARAGRARRGARSGGTAPAWRGSHAAHGGSRPSCQWPSKNSRSCGLWHRWRSS